MTTQVLLRVVPDANCARWFLYRAAAALNDGRYIEAGVLLREALRRQAWAECVYADCLPQGASLRTPALTLVYELRKAGQFAGEEDDWFETYKRAIAVGNAAAHCMEVEPGEIRVLILNLHQAIDANPCGELEFGTESPESKGVAI